jgi:hypothetical protein
MINDFSDAFDDFEIEQAVASFSALTILEIVRFCEIMKEKGIEIEVFIGPSAA